MVVSQFPSPSFCSYPSTSCASTCIVFSSWSHRHASPKDRPRAIWRAWKSKEVICWRHSPLECLEFVQPEDGRTGHSKRTSRFASRWQGFSNGSRVYSISEYCQRDGRRHTVRSGSNHEQVDRREGPAGVHRLEQKVCLEDGNAGACWSLHLLTLRDSF